MKISVFLKLLRILSNELYFNVFFLIFQSWQLWNFVKNKMLKHDMYCLETASEEDGTPALLRECNENNSNQVFNIIQCTVDFIIWTVNNWQATDIHCNLEKIDCVKLSLKYI